MPECLANEHPGNMSHARRLKTANRVLRLYVATESSDENLLLMVNFIVKPQAQRGTTHQFHMMNALQVMSLPIYGKINIFLYFFMRGALNVL